MVVPWMLLFFFFFPPPVFKEPVILHDWFKNGFIKEAYDWIRCKALANRSLEGGTFVG